jgi:hypothetical protein
MDCILCMYTLLQTIVLLVIGLKDICLLCDCAFHIRSSRAKRIARHLLLLLRYG